MNQVMCKTPKQEVFPGCMDWTWELRRERMRLPLGFPGHSFLFFFVCLPYSFLSNIFQSQIQTPRRKIDWLSLNEFANNSISFSVENNKPKSKHINMAWVLYSFSLEKKVSYRGHRIGQVL